MSSPWLNAAIYRLGTHDAQVADSGIQQRNFVYVGVTEVDAVVELIPRLLLTYRRGDLELNVHTYTRHSKTFSFVTISLDS